MKKYDGKKIVVMSQAYTVHEVVPEDEHNWARVIYIDKKVELNKTMPEDNKSVALLHEVIHIINETTGHKMTEGHVDAISYGLIDVMKNSPWLKEIF